MVKITKKQLLKKHKQAKKKIKFLRNHPLLMPVSVFFVIVFFGLGMFVTVGATTVGANDKKIVNLYVDGEQQTLSTRAKTVEDLLNRLDIKLLEEDLVEPNRGTLLFEDNTQVNVYRARPVAVVDGDRTITVLTAQRAPRLVAADAGLKLQPEDEVSPIRIEEIASLTEPAEKLVITRAVEVQLNVYGVLSKKRTTLNSVQEFLDANNIKVENGATVQPSDTSAKITPGLLIAVNKVGIKTITELQPVAFNTEVREDNSLQVGESRIETEGQNGEQTVVYEIVEKDGVEESRRVLETIVTIEPVTQVRIEGKKPATLSASISVSDDKASLMAAAGIAPADYPYVDYIISRESGWRPGAVNSSSGAYGLCQALPGGKMTSAGADWRTNPVTQLRWCSGYATGRYGGWAGAYNAWLVQHWW